VSGGDGSSGSNMAIKRRRPFQVGWGGCGFRAPFMFDSGNGMVRGFSFQKVPKCDWHGPRSHINHVLPIKTADQIPAEVVQMGIEDDGNPRPLFVVAKNLTVANYGDILAGLRIDNIAVEHGFLVCVSDVTFTTPESAALFRSPCYLPWVPRDGALTLSDVRSPTLDCLRAVQAARTLQRGEAHGAARRRDTA
jgi:hypothetical protein